MERQIDGRRWGYSRWWPGRHWWWQWRAREGGEIGRGGAGRGGEPVRPFYRRGKVGSARIFEEKKNEKREKEKEKRKKEIRKRKIREEK
jgi:hypothetical protein